MFLRKIILLFSIILVHLSFAQKRKKVDTVYVYEKVIVYDTVYLEKPIKLSLKDITISQPKINEIEIKNKSFLSEPGKEITKRRIFEYGIEAGIGLKNSSLAKDIANKSQLGENIGMWISKSIIKPQLSLMLSANIYRWNSTFDLDANKEETYLDGFYFSKDAQPLLFQRFNNKNFEYVLQLKLFYEWKNIRPFAGFLINRNSYKMQFLVPDNGVLNKLDDFKSNNTNFGFSMGVQYRILKRFLISMEYQQYKIKNFSLKNSDFDFDIFKTNNTFAERKINVGISYIISKL
ncbi:hypothetical protein ASG22_15925 [Chryseobacterium sp. Leaf405]|uniref:outer membrane beta-barrel protein n=1 Tax=Chryseobacterium sp. Leaf405 TaxID=1736367 RepID=UPI0006FFA89D|nr:outer membrane beta-barrel protein [Chryseobacterium sp. Leaf405]KQT21641.1 hypothetical protein ASG22_15925 [Chryseobacterium sp. Leaf405]